jgi:hypothetical protein
MLVLVNKAGWAGCGVRFVWGEGGCRDHTPPVAQQRACSKCVQTMVHTRVGCCLACVQQLALLETSRLLGIHIQTLSLHWGSLDRCIESMNCIVKIKSECEDRVVRPWARQHSAH